MADSQKQMGFIDAEQNRQTADAAMNLRLASQTGDPLTMQKAIQQANPVLQRFGLPAEEVYQSWQNDPQEFNRITDLIHLHADPNSYFSVQESSKGRVLHSRTQIHLHIMLRLMRSRVIGVSIWSSSKSYPITNYAREKWF
nr:phage DNA ejection protein [Escherichia coli]